MSNKTLLITTILTVSLLSGCEQANQYAPPPPPAVTVAQPLQKAVTDYLEFTGTTRAYEEVEVRARVPGFLLSRHFTPGTRVTEGELLFVIDPREYSAQLSAAEAELESAKAELNRAEIEFARAERLYKQKAGTDVEVVKWRGDRALAEAAIMRAEAKIERARLNLSYTQVRAPIRGRVGRNLLDTGALVGESEPTLLTTVTDSVPMYAYFNLNERDLLQALELYRSKVREKNIDPDNDPDRSAGIPLYLGLVNEEGYPHKGVVDFAETGVDPDTGTLQLRGLFPNEEKPPLLLPGLFARIRMPIKERPDALLVTERAIGADQEGRYVLVVNNENVVEKRPRSPRSTGRRNAGDRGRGASRRVAHRQGCSTGPPGGQGRAGTSRHDLAKRFRPRRRCKARQQKATPVGDKPMPTAGADQETAVTGEQSAQAHMLPADKSPDKPASSGQMEKP